MISNSKSDTNGYFSLHLTDLSTNMDVNNPDIGEDPAAIAQPVVAPVGGGAPLDGINFLLDAIGFQNPAEHLCLIKAGLADYKDFHYLVKRIYRIWQKSSPSRWCHRATLLLVSVASRDLQGSCIGSRIVSIRGARHPRSAV